MARVAGERTQAIRNLLEKNPNLTYNDGGKAALEKLGITEGNKDSNKAIDENTFNVTKHLWLKSKGQSHVRVKGAKKVKTTKVGRRPSEPKKVSFGGKRGAETAARSFQAITQAGGLAAVKQSITDKRTQIETLESEVAELTAAVESFEQLVQAAS